ncbi:MAG: hypothetical protein EOR84_22430 [Mesorhizobium sp.]|uniref:hypothetical protein n=1 Tax=Mesorhizobium sp. TaxID=1871066 RepID=UPI000FE4BCD9|nr:hypothetical protein [Mesorhizobium sp.]RWM90201.1 MAG: hypothetical protein EOR84_22430 [Mesorhizobium sp.]
MLKNVQPRHTFSKLVNHAADAGIAALGWTAREAFRTGEASQGGLRACLIGGAILKIVKAGDRVKSFG